MIVFVLLSGCSGGPAYHENSIPDRKLNLLGLEMIATRHLDAHPEDFDKFSRILTAADDALQRHSTMSRGAVISWIRKMLKREEIEEALPVYQFLRTVYLKGWEGAYWRTVDEAEREYLYDLMGAVMGGMHRCVCPPMQE